MRDLKPKMACGDLNFSVKPSAGVEGNLFVANAYMGVSGDLNCNFKLPMNSFKTDFKANFSASVFFEWNALAWGARHDWNFVDLQIYPKAKKTLNVSPNDLQFIKPVGDTASADIKMARTIPNTFKENLQIYAKPKIVSLNKKSITIFTFRLILHIPVLLSQTNQLCFQQKYIIVAQKQLIVLKWKYRTKTVHRYSQLLLKSQSE